ncbi:MAG: TonB-dependent receptor [Tannerella sp.]|jgi:iron complex outermembrane receptor protein|nr:TonB-dependent receptor [Tannerella sp.]
MKKICILLITSMLISASIMAQSDLQTTNFAADSVKLDEVLIIGSRVHATRDVMPTPVSIVSRQAIEQSGSSTLFPILTEQTPGLFVTSRGVLGYGVSSNAAGNVSLRGMTGGAGRVLVLIDGHPQYASIFGHPVGDAYMSGDAERVEVFHGSASTLYGSNAMGGAINIVTRKMLHDGNRFKARLSGGSYGTAQAQVSDSYRNGGLTFFVAGGYDHTDGHRPNSQFDSYNGAAKIGYELTDAWKVTGNASFTKFKSEDPGPANNPMFESMRDIMRQVASVSLENNYDFTSGAVNFYFNYGEHNINDGYASGGTPREFLFHSTDYMGGVNIYQSIKPFTGNTLTGGVDVKLYGGNAYRNPETEVYADHKKLHETAGYLFVEQEVARFMLNAGIRLESNSLYGNEWAPMAGISFRAAKATTLKLSVTKGFRSPNMRELYMYGMGNEELKPERSLTYDFTVSSYLLDNRLSGDLSLFYIKGDNIATLAQVNNKMQWVNSGKFVNKGVEVGLKFRASQNLLLNSNYSYLDMDTPITGAPEHKFYVGANFSKGKYSLGGGVMHISGLYLSTGNEAQKSNYTILKARAGYRIAKSIELFVNGDNLLAQKYETMLGFPMPRATFNGGITVDL